MQSPKPVSVYKYTNSNVSDGKSNRTGTSNVEVLILPKQQSVTCAQTVNAVGNRNQRQTDSQKPHLETTACGRISQVLRMVEGCAMLFVCPKSHTRESTQSLAQPETTNSIGVDSNDVSGHTVTRLVSVSKSYMPA